MGGECNFCNMSCLILPALYIAWGYHEPNGTIGVFSWDVKLKKKRIISSIKEIEYSARSTE